MKGREHRDGVVLGPGMAAGGERRAQGVAARIACVICAQTQLDRVEPRALHIGAQIGVVGDVVGGAHYIVEGPHGRSQPRRQQKRAHREIF
nr:hypothetical protein [Limimaricola cinnabarinus]